MPTEPTYPTYSVTVTGYNAVPGQTDGDPFTTASGAYSDPDVVAARSVDLADELPFGTVIALAPAGTSTSMCGLQNVEDSVGLRVIADSMNPRIHNAVDILFDTDNEVRSQGRMRNAASAIGLCKGTEIAIVGHVDVNHMPRTQTELKAALQKAMLASK